MVGAERVRKPRFGAATSFLREMFPRFWVTSQLVLGIYFFVVDRPIMPIREREKRKTQRNNECFFFTYVRNTPRTGEFNLWFLKVVDLKKNWMNI